MKKYRKLVFIVPMLFTVSSCKPYIEFEKMRFEYIFYLFVITLIIGILGYMFRKKD